MTDLFPICISFSHNLIESSWNPVTGCTAISTGCKHCYAKRMAYRLQAMGSPRYRDGFSVTLHRDQLEAPLRWRKPRTIFVNSMSDLFHRSVSDGFITQVFETMNRAHWHVFQVLTKRSRRLNRLASALPWSKNIWMGVTVENAAFLSRIEDLVAVPAHVRFLSLEPLLGPIHELPLDVIDWVIVGGESGPRARPMKSDWVREVRDRCRRASVPFFFKQWGGLNKKKAGRLLDGRTWDDLPLP